MYRHNGRRRMDRKIDCSVSGNGVFSNVIGSWRSAYPVSFVVPGAPQNRTLAHAPFRSGRVNRLDHVLSLRHHRHLAYGTTPLRSCTRCSRPTTSYGQPTGSSCVRSSCPSLRASITPPGLPLPSFHAYQHKTNRGMAVKSSQQFLYVLYTPYSTTSLYFPIASWPSMARVNGPARAWGGACVST